MAATFGVFVDVDNCKVPTLYVLPKHKKIPYKSKEEGKDQVSIQSRTTLEPGHHRGK